MSANRAASRLKAENLMPGRRLGDLARRAARRLPIALVLFALVGAGLVAAVRLTPTTYRSVSVLAITPQATNLGAPAGGDAAVRSAMVDAEVGILNSQPMSDRIMSELKRRRDASQPTVEIAAGEIPRSVKAHRRGASYLVEVGATSLAKGDAQILADAAVEAYQFSRLDEQSAVHVAGSAAAQRAASPEIELAKKKLAALEAQRLELTAASTKPGPENKADDEKLRQASSQLQAMKKGAAEVKTLLRSDVATGDVAAFRASGVLDQLGDVAAPLATQVAAYESGDPAKRDDAKYRILTEASRLSATLDSNIAGLNADVSRMSKAANAAPASTPDTTKRLPALDTEISAQRKLIDTAATASASTVPAAKPFVDVRVVSRAAPGIAPLWRRHLVLYLAAGVVDLLLLTVFLVFAAMTSDTIIDPRDAGALAGVQTVVSIPRIAGWRLKRLPPGERHPANFAVEDPTSPIADALRELLEKVRPGPSQRNANCIVVVSAQPGDGATAVSLGLARMAASAGMSVLLVDGDFDRGGLTKAMGVQPGQGVETLIEGGLSIAQVVVEDDVTSVHLLPSSPEKGRGGALSLAQLSALKEALDAARSSYDLVLIDCQPHASRSRTWSVTRMADAAVIVAAYDVTRRVQLSGVARRVQQNGARIRAIALNLAPEKSTQSDAAFPSVREHAQRAVDFDGGGSDVIPLRGAR